MSTNWLRDINEMHRYFGTDAAVAKLSKEELLHFLKFRVSCLQEELDEIKTAIEEKDADGIIDGLIDLAVFDIGTLDLFLVDGYDAWNEVYKANITKEVGIKEGRPNPFKLPDLVKPDGWQAPSHENNPGYFVLKEILE